MVFRKVSKRKEEERKRDIKGENNIKNDENVDMTRYFLESSARRQLSWQPR